MEIIHMDARRVWRSVLDLAHARRDALTLSGRMAGKQGRAPRRNIDTSTSRDVYGRENRADMYAREEAIELYKRLSFDKRPPL
ncbi:MAG: hypothetical protein ABFC85_09930 [Rectinema sp.]|jgi:hypothetical protein|uniref:Uncharacterized protein n=1 Tax=uncultured spirochete TaxID=156406 RepID=A0A3P3XMJ5_9SPIR|nr:hypothetical protein SPIRO4BDMA_40086 [uncultured spirochete]